MKAILSAGFTLALAAAALLSPCGAFAETAGTKGADMSVGHITGIGGLFFKSKDPKALAAWYRDVLGLKVEAWGGAMLSYDAPGHPAVAVWSAFPETTDYMAPSTREYMVNFAVDDLDAIIAKLESKGVKILKREDQDANGKFAWILDPDGTKIELWEPKGK
jgi:catechol 2,3-dioxygenase-like lactoylglutathione lyase family enzyme